MYDNPKTQAQNIWHFDGSVLKRIYSIWRQIERIKSIASYSFGPINCLLFAFERRPIFSSYTRRWADANAITTDLFFFFFRFIFWFWVGVSCKHDLFFVSFLFLFILVYVSLSSLAPDSKISKHILHLYCGIICELYSCKSTLLYYGKLLYLFGFVYNACIKPK